LPIKAVSFDFWHTLFTEQPGAFLLYQDKRRSLLANALLSYRNFADAELERACVVEAESHFMIWQDQHRTSLASERVGRILSHLEVCLPDESLSELVVSFEELLLEHPPILIGGAREALTQLSERYRLGIISDVGFSPGRVLKQVLAAHDLLHLFDSLVFSDEAGRAKPHLEVFKRTARSLSVEPGEMVHVGDLERTDIIGAKQAGHGAIRFTGITSMEEGETTIADFVTDDLTDVPSLVGMLGGGLQ
jgi:HAD superfamily hydrolase (TIGR01549 family)